jgi:hypothetical protein
MPSSMIDSASEAIIDPFEQLDSVYISETKQRTVTRVTNSQAQQSQQPQGRLPQAQPPQNDQSEPSPGPLKQVKKALREPRWLEGHAGQVTSLVFAPDGRLSQAATQAVTGRPNMGQSGCGISKRAARSSGCCVMVATPTASRSRPTANSSRAVEEMESFGLWDVATGREEQQLESFHGAVISGVAFSSNGRLVASTCNGGSGVNWGAIRLWDVASGLANHVNPG